MAEDCRHRAVRHVGCITAQFDGSDSAEPFGVTIAATTFKEILIRRNRENKSQLPRPGIRGLMHYSSVRIPGEPTTTFPSRATFIRGRVSASPSSTRSRSHVRETRPRGSAQWALSNERPYRENTGNPASVIVPPKSLSAAIRRSGSGIRCESSVSARRPYCPQGDSAHVAGISREGASHELRRHQICASPPPWESFFHISKIVYEEAFDP